MMKADVVHTNGGWRIELTNRVFVIFNRQGEKITEYDNFDEAYSMCGKYKITEETKSKGGTYGEHKKIV